MIFLLLSLSSEVTYSLSLDKKVVQFFGDSEELTQQNVEESKVYSKYEEAVIHKGITSIGISCFSRCINLKTVNISSTVKVLKKSSFAECSSLEVIRVPEGVREIHDSCFAYSGIQSMELPSSLKSLGCRTFEGVPNLKSIDIDYNEVFSSIGDSKFLVKNKVVLVAVASAYTELTVPAQIEIIEEKVFESVSKLTSLKFAEGSNLSEIKYYGFRKSGILEMRIPEGTKILGASLFDRCPIRTLWLPSTLVSVSKDVLLDCYSIQTVYVASNCSALSCDSTGTVFNSNKTAVIFMPSNISSFEVPDTIESIIPTLLTLKRNLTELNASKDCSTYYVKNNTLYEKKTKTLVAVIGGVEVIEVEPECQYIGYSSFKNSIVKKVTFAGTKLITIRTTAFEGVAELNQMVLPDGLSSLQNYAFSGVSMPGLVFPGSFQTLASHALCGCRAKTIDLRSCLSLTLIPENAFLRSDVENLYLAPNVVSIGSCAMMSCGKLKTISIPRNVRNLNQSSFEGSALESITFDPSSHLEIINARCFARTGLRSIKIPDSVTEIGEYVFDGCLSLENIEFSKDSNLSIVSPFVFNDCGSLKSVKFGAGLQTIQPCALSGAPNLAYVTFPADSIFRSVNGIVYSDEMATLVLCLACVGSIAIDSNVEKISGSAFFGCDKLSEVSFGSDSHLISIGQSTFYGCVSLKSLTLPMHLKIISDSCFSRCNSLSNVTFVDESEVSSIEIRAFAGCPLEIIDLRNCKLLKSLGPSAFESCSSLSDVYLAHNIISIGSNCFAGCLNLTRIEFCSLSEFDNQMCSSNVIPANRNLRVFVNFEYSPDTFCSMPVERVMDKKCNYPTIRFSNGEIGSCQSSSAVGLLLFQNDDSI